LDDLGPTGEPFQPVRLHYLVFNRKGLLQAFQKLRCVQDDRPRERWVWLYNHEAKTLRFKNAYHQLPEHRGPVVIGCFRLRGQDKLLLDLRSCERALAAVEFFDRHIPRSVAKATEAEVVNKLFSAQSPQLRPETVFDHQCGPQPDLEAEGQRIRERVAPIPEPHEMGFENMKSLANLPLPEIERFPIHFYEDGMAGLTLALRVRQIIAMQHWSGNTEYSFGDAIKAVMGTT
jgi:hypothetical protein